MLKRLFAAIILILSLSFITGCEKSNQPKTAADAVAGIYSGKLSYGAEVLQDAYVVRIVKMTSNVVTIYADFLNGSKNYNVVPRSGIYVISSETDPNITASVSGKSLTISYITSSKLLATFYGERD